MSRPEPVHPLGPSQAEPEGPLQRDLIVVGASAGGVEALVELFGALPAGLPAAVAVVLHLPPQAPSALRPILARRCRLQVEVARDGTPLQLGHVYLAVPDHHLLVRAGTGAPRPGTGLGVVRLGRGPRENGHRPAADPLFRSAARWFGPRTIAVMLSGTLDDGAAGALGVHLRGGEVLVQEPAEALYDGMPRAVLAAVPSARAARLPDLARLLVERAGSPAAVPADPAGDDVRDLVLETEMAEMDEGALQEPDRPGRPSGLACPDCHGALFEIDEPSMVRYRCRVGHAWSPEALMVAKDDEVEGALWVALRTLEERVALHHRLGRKASGAGRAHLAARGAERAREAKRSAEVIRRMLQRGDGEEAERAQE